MKMTAERALAPAVRNLSVLAYANGFTQWHYNASGDEIQFVATPGFWREVGHMLSPGDIVFCTSATGAQQLLIVRDGADTVRAVLMMQAFA